MTAVAQQPLTRADIGSFTQAPRVIRFFENLSANVSANTATADAVANATFVTLTPDTTLGGSRVLTVEPSLTLTDGGAGSTVALDMSLTGVTAGAYGSASEVAVIGVSARGRLYDAVTTPIAIDAGQVVSGTLTVPFGGTGAATLTGYVLGNGTAAMTASPTIPVSDVTGAVSLTGVESVTNKTFDQLRTVQTPTTAVVVQAHWVPIVLNGVTYKLLLAT